MNEQRVKDLYRLTKRELAVEYRKVLATNGKTLVYGGPVTKEEYVRAILQEEEAA